MCRTHGSANRTYVIYFSPRGDSWPSVVHKFLLISSSIFFPSYFASFLPSFFPSAERREEKEKEIKVLQGAHDEIIRIETSRRRFKGQHIKAYVMVSRVKDDTNQLFLSSVVQRMSKRRDTASFLRFF